MTLRIQWHKAALKSLRKLERSQAQKLIAAIQNFAAQGQGDVKKMQGTESEYRLRVGDYRIVFEQDEQSISILVLKVGHRREIYRG